MGNLASRMPRRSRSQLGLFKQKYIRPALVSQVIGQTAAHDTATDNHNASGPWNGSVLIRHN